jgi:hypothetical protein
MTRVCKGIILFFLLNSFHNDKHFIPLDIIRHVNYLQHFWILRDAT